MTAGMQVKSDADTHQIDSNYSNIFLNRKVVINSTTPVDLNLANDEFVCVMPDIGQSISTSYYVYGVVGYVGQGIAYIFKNTPISPMQPGDAGLEVYKPDGSVAYNSKSKPLRVIGSYTHSDNDVKNVTSNIDALGFLCSTGMVFSIWSYGEQTNSHFHTLYTTFAYRNESGDYYLKREQVAEWIAPHPYPLTIHPSSKGLLVDLSGY